MKISKRELDFDIQELDRKRIAGHMHDTSLQNLTYVLHKLELASMYIDKNMDRAKLEIFTARKNINLVIEEIRDTIYDLHPIMYDNLDLKLEIKKLLEKASQNSDIEISYDIDEVQLNDRSVLMAFYRISQECINNVRRHARAKHLSLLLKNLEDRIELFVEDDGIGFDMEEVPKDEMHFGLLLMRERVESLSGELKITSELNKGTKVYMSISKNRENDD